MTKKQSRAIESNQTSPQQKCKGGLEESSSVSAIAFGLWLAYLGVSSPTLSIWPPPYFSLLLLLLDCGCAA